MSRFCERPGCSAPASIAYGIDAERLRVWLDVLDVDGAGDRRVGVLCRRHADAMVVPLGWMLDDLREAVPRLFKLNATTNPPDSTAEIVRRRRGPSRPPRGEQLELVAPALPVVSDEATADAEIAAQIAGLLADDTAQLRRTVEIEIEIEAAERAAAAERAQAVVEPEPEPEPVQDLGTESVAGAADLAPRTEEPEAEQEPEPHPEPEPEPEPAQATLWSPVFDEGDDLGGLLSASSPLLSRAFGQTRRRSKKRS